MIIKSNSLHKKKIMLREALLEITMLIITLISAYPLFIIVISIFKSPAEMVDWISFPSGIYLGNIINVVLKEKLYIPFLNSMFVTSITITLLVVIGSMAAYAFGRREEKIFNYLYLYITLGLMLPLQFSILPIFQLIKGFGLMNTRAALIICGLSFNIAVTVFIYKNFIKSISKSLEEAATIDGCSYFIMFWRIIFPLLKPATATVIITNLLGVWNDFLSPLLVVSDTAKKTIPIFLLGFKGQYGNNIGAIFTTITFASLPLVIVFLLLQNYFYKGISAGAVKF